MAEPEKLTLLTIDELRMDEVATFEKMSGLSISQVYAGAAEDGGTPSAAIMALAYLTEKRHNRGASKKRWQDMSFLEFTAEINERFDFATVDDDSAEDGDGAGDGEDPTNAA